MQKLVLAVDDNAENLKILGTILQKNGLKTAFAKSGVQALHVIERKLPDLILLDIMMPVMDGYEVCKHLKANVNTKNIPVIFLTAKAETEDLIKGLKLGAVDYVTKPFHEGELMTRINVHLRLKATEEQLRQTIAEKDRFFAIISHDLVNIFSGSIGAISLILEDEANESDPELLILVQQGLEKGHNLLRNLLDWSRSQTGRLKTKPMLVDVNSIVEQNISLLENNTLAKNITMFSSINSETLVLADKNMLHTIIRNLLSNAIKFTPTGGKIEITSQIKENKLEISIMDTGVGIRAEDIDKLFRIDVSHSTYGTEKEKGTGLGLLLCKEFIEKNNGNIGVDSKEGQGSRFYIQLPCSPNYSVSRLDDAHLLT